MIITLILLSSLLSLLHYLGLGEPIAWAINLPLSYHIGFTITLIGFRLGLALCKWVQIWTDTIRKLMESIERLNSQRRSLGQSSSTPPGSKGNKGVRSMSTSALQSGRNIQVKTAPLNKSKPKGILGKSLRLSQSIFGKKKVGTFFRSVAKHGALVSLSSKSKRPKLTNLIRLVGFRIFGAAFTAKGKYLSRLRQLNAFLVRLQRLHRFHGEAYVVKELKVSQLALQKAIARTPVSSLRVLEPTLPLNRVTAQGFPKWIPVRDRRQMYIAGSPAIIRWYMTLFSIYRVIYIPGTLKLSTITDICTVSQSSVNQVASDIIRIIPKTSFGLSKLFEHNLPAFKVGRLGLPSIPLLEAASSSTKISWLGLITDIAAFKASGQFSTLCYYLFLTKNYSLLKLVIHIADRLPHSGKLWFSQGLGELLIKDAPLGRLSLKEEAAGKVRVFAMVTIWDQTVLKPLHDMLFAWLKGLPNDGTFNQDAAVRRCLAKSTLTKNSFGYDLSAATDRLPLSLQKDILSALVPLLGDIWALLLTSRTYFLKASKKYQTVDQWLRYAVGQPMGAKSSWAMLALTHHMTAQLAAWRHRVSPGGALDPHGFWVTLSGFPLGWYTGYEVLGDDIVFFEKGVAHQYLIIMDQLGVPINLSKSVIANNATFEFAKVTGHKGHHVGAISWAMFMMCPTAMGRVGIAYHLLMKRICQGHFIRYITTLSRESKYSVGSPNIFFVALGTMFAKAGRLSYSDFFGSILTFKPDQVTLTDNLNTRGALAPLERALAKILATPGITVVEITKTVSQALGFKVDSVALAHALASTIVNFTYGKLNPDGYRYNHLDPHKDALAFAKKVVCAQGGLGYEARDRLMLELEAQGAFKLVPGAYSKMGPEGQLLHPLFCVLFAQAYEFLNKKYEILTAVKPLQMKSLPITELMSLLDVIARYKEYIELVERADEKLANMGEPKKVNLIDNPLEVLIQILKSETDIAYMRGVVLATGTEAIQRLIQEGGPALRAIFSPEKDVVDKTSWNTSLGSIPLDRIRAYISEFGEAFVTEHLPKWGKYAHMMFKEPLDIKLPDPYNYLKGQPDYLYAISALDYILPDLKVNLVTEKVVVVDNNGDTYDETRFISESFGNFSLEGLMLHLQFPPIHIDNPGAIDDDEDIEEENVEVLMSEN